MIYIKEAHADDEGRIPTNRFEGICYKQPRSLTERREVAQTFVEQAGLQLPLVLDNMQNDALEAYGGWPERLYVVGADGRIVYKGGMGPFGFDPDEVEDWLSARRTVPVTAVAQDASGGPERDESGS